MKVRATLERRGGGMSGAWIGGPNEWGQVSGYDLEWKEIGTMLRLLKMRLDLSLGTLSAEGQGYPEVTKLKRAYHTCLRQYKYKNVAVTGLHKCVTYK